MCSVNLVNSVNFRGGETCGTPAKSLPISHSLNDNRSNSVNFKGYASEDVYVSDKKSKAKKAWIAAGISVATLAAAFVGLGYLGKSQKIANMKDTSWVKKILNPVTEACYNGCKWLKNLLPKGTKKA